MGDLALPHLAMLIEEAFAVLSWQSGELIRPLEQMTVQELAAEAQLPVEQVIQRLESIKAMTQDLEIDPLSLQQLLKAEGDNVFLLDVREAWEFDICSLPESRLLARTDLAQIFEGLKEFEVVTLCHHGARSLSAALYLKESGLPRVRSLRGGLDQWAQQVDRSMARY